MDSLLIISFIYTNCSSMTMPVVLNVKVHVDNKGNKAGCWIYLPKILYQLLNEPSAFEAEMQNNKLILTPLKEKKK